MDSFNRRFGIKGDLSGLVTNPFTNAFTEEEIDFYDLGEPYSKDGVSVSLVTPSGRLDDYLNMNYRVGDIPRVPILKIDGRVWMSLTPMEIQSAYLPIMMATGIVGTAGLGLGYYPLRAASNPNVEEVHVYEIEPRIIEFFLSSFKGRPELDKIQIHHQDVRKLSHTEKRNGFDTFFMDVYRTMLPEEVVDDILIFQGVDIDLRNYRFWGMEKVFLDSIMHEERPQISYQDRAYLKTWKNTPLDPDDPELEDEKLSQLYRPTTDEDYRAAVFEALDIRSTL